MPVNEPCNRYALSLHLILDLGGDQSFIKGQSKYTIYKNIENDSQPHDDDDVDDDDDNDDDDDDDDDKDDPVELHIYGKKVVFARI